MVACILIASCSSSTQPLPEVSPLLIASCPELTPMTDSDFGATTKKLLEVIQIYHTCRTAALAETK